MQSEPSDIFNRPHTVEPSSEDLFHSTQHGHDLYGVSQVSGRLPEDAGDSVDSDSSIGEPSFLKHSESSPAVDQVSHYEETVFGSSRRHSDFGFIVTPNSKPSDLSLDDFPNGGSCPIIVTDMIMCLTSAS
jgi:hypothetical protein